MVGTWHVEVERTSNDETIGGFYLFKKHRQVILDHAFKGLVSAQFKAELTRPDVQVCNLNDPRRYVWQSMKRFSEE